MKKDLSEIICVIDKSGSMHQYTNDTIGGFNKFLQEQRDLPGEARMTITLFDTTCHTIVDGEDIKKVEDLTRATYAPDGMTAMLDAIGSSIDKVGDRLDKIPEDERPANIIVVIITDGEENSSSDYAEAKIKEMITHQKEVYNWKFVFLGSFDGTFSEAAKIGVAAVDSMQFDNSSKGFTQAYRTAGLYMSSVRGGAVADDYSLADAVAEDQSQNPDPQA